MGCDIHLFVEKKVKGRWVSADKWTQDEHEPDRKIVDYDDRFYSSRCYNLFAILADVRNGVGFAGIPTGEGFKIIADPRGIPLDACAEVKKESDDWGGDGHSHSHFTVAELLAFDWTQRTKLSGVVNAVEFWNWSQWRRKAGEAPEEYCGGAGGPNVRHISIAEMIMEVNNVVKNCGPNARRDVIEKALGDKLQWTYTTIEWTSPYYKCAKEFWYSVIPRLLQLGKQDEVRIVFWFDN